MSVEDQRAADERIPLLLQCPAAVRWISAEPLLGPIDLQYPPSLFGDDGPRMCCSGHECGCMGLPIEPPLIYGINWVVAGGESGPGARPMHPDWARSLRDQCAAARVPFLFKQWGNWANSEAAGLDLNACYGDRGRGGWVETDGTHTTGEASAPQRAGASHVFNLPKASTGRLLDGVLHDAYPRLEKAA